MTALHTGEKLDHYVIDNLVARSDMAAIYRATDELTGKLVAIKMPHHEMEADPVFFERFHREQEIGEKLDHPGVMKVYPSAHHSQVYMVMEWVDGRVFTDATLPGLAPAERSQQEVFLFHHDYFDEARQFGKGYVSWFVTRVKDPSHSADVARRAASFQPAASGAQTSTFCRVPTIEWPL